MSLSGPVDCVCLSACMSVRERAAVNEAKKVENDKG